MPIVNNIERLICRSLHRPIGKFVRHCFKKRLVEGVEAITSFLPAGTPTTLKTRIDFVHTTIRSGLKAVEILRASGDLYTKIMRSESESFRAI